MTAPHNLIGPLTTTFTPAPSCTDIIPYDALAPLTNIAPLYAAQACVAGLPYQDPACIPGPPTSMTATVDDTMSVAQTATLNVPQSGFFSPGLICPVGWTTACGSNIPAATATTNAAPQITNFDFLYNIDDTETAAGCCPTGYGCTIHTGLATMQQCVSTIRDTTIRTSPCKSGTHDPSAEPLTLPRTTTASSDTVTISEASVFAPMVQLVWRASDRGSKIDNATMTEANLAGTSAAAVASPPNHTISPAAIAGAAFGGVAVLAAVVGLVVFLLITRKRAKARTANEEEFEAWRMGKAELGSTEPGSGSNKGSVGSMGSVQCIAEKSGIEVYEMNGSRSRSVSLRRGLWRGKALPPVPMVPVELAAERSRSRGRARERER